MMQKKTTVMKIGIGVLLAVLIFIYLYPVYLVVINSFKPFKEMFQSYIAFPKSFYIDNYVTAIQASGFINGLMNNLIITIVSVVGIIGVTAMAAYKLSRVKTRLSSFFYMLFTVPFLIPFYSYMIPLVQLMTKLKMMNSLLGLAVFWIASSSFSLFMFHGFIKGIPVELDESARIDGCSDFGIYTRIIFPLLKPIISSVAVLYSIWTWNDFLLPFLMLNNPKKHTITITVYQMFGKYGSDWDIITATLILATLPMIIVYIILQKYVVSGIVAGAVKG